MHASTAPQQARFPVTVLMRRHRGEHRGWPIDRWDVEGVVAGEHLALAAHAEGQAAEGGAVAGAVVAGAASPPVDAESERIVSGLAIELHRDAAELYYGNLVSEEPSVFVICRPEEDGSTMRPFLVSLNPDDAAAHLDVDDAVSRLPISPELYVWLEAFVLEHYVPKAHYKRSLNRDDRDRKEKRRR